MGVLIVILLLLAAMAGILGTVLKVAAGVALGLFIGIAALVWFATWRFRRAIRGPQWRKVKGSKVEVLDRRYR